VSLSDESPVSGRIEQAGQGVVTVVETNQDDTGPDMKGFCDDIRTHYSKIWVNVPSVRKWRKGPTHELPLSFSILEFPPSETRQMWTYATCCLSQPTDTAPIELHLFSPVQSEGLVELLTVIAHYHRNDEKLGVGHTINLGRPWLGESRCDHGLISLPYLDGPAIEEYRSQGTNQVIRCLWLIPITMSEQQFKKRKGLTALENKFEQTQVDYVDPDRASVV
jgi:hypothetical protein